MPQTIGLYQTAWDQCRTRRDKPVMGDLPLISIVDDDESVRESLLDLLKELGFRARIFSSAEDFLALGDLSETRCLILDVAMSGMSGPDLQQELKRRRIEIPIVFITASKNENLRARLFERGAVGYLLKPFSDTALLAALRLALRMD